MKKKLLQMMTVMVCVLAMTACQQKAVEIKSEKAQEQEASTSKDTTSSETSSSDTSDTKTSSKKTKKVAELSEDLYDFQISVKGKIYKLPMTYAKFTKAGWSYEGNEEDIIHPSEQILSDWFQKGNDMSLAYFTNFDQANMTVADAYLSGLMFERDYIKDEKTTIVLAKDITLGVSTLDEVKAAYGNPTSAVENGIFPTLTYSKDENSYVELGFDSKNGNVLAEITMHNSVVPSNFKSSDSETDAATETTEDDTSEKIIYTTPTAISQDAFAYTFSFAGVLYQLPVPVSEFVANGWSIVNETSTQIVESLKTGKVTLLKDDQTLWLYATNVSEDDAEISDCIVSNIAANVKDCNVDMEIAGGIKMGMTQNELEKAIASYGYKKEESRYIYYEIPDPNEKESGYEIIVKDGKVTGIEIRS